jgi:hypothetical protein
MITKQQLINNGDVWTLDDKWFRKCPSCNNVVMHTAYGNCRRLHLEHHICSSCAGKLTSIRMIGKPSPMLGRHHTEESNRKNSESHKGQVGYFRGKRLSLEHRKNLSKSHIGISNGPASEERKKKIGLANKGNIPWCKGKQIGPQSEDTKRKLRCIMLQRFLDTGMATCIDTGSKQWFDKYNKEHNTNFKPTPFPNTLGYDADGYDNRLHAWIEYDTKYHTTPYQKKRDLIRQNNIIKYFEDMGEPLTEFKRVLAYNKEEVKTVYRGYEYA